MRVVKSRSAGKFEIELDDKTRLRHSSGTLRMFPSRAQAEFVVHSKRELEAMEARQAR
jgi:hypothetical protein